MRGARQATTATGKSMGNAVLHPSQTLRGAGQAVKTATVGGAFGYVGWKKLTTDASVARIVSEAVVGKPATNVLAGTVDDTRELKEKTGETVSAIGSAVRGAGSQLNGVSNFMQATSGGGLLNMLGGFFSNLGRGNVSGLSIAGLVAARSSCSDNAVGWARLPGCSWECCSSATTRVFSARHHRRVYRGHRHRHSLRRSRPRAAE